MRQELEVHFYLRKAKLVRLKEFTGMFKLFETSKNSCFQQLGLLDPCA